MTAHPDDATERTEHRLSYEATFESLQNPRRRWTLEYLLEAGGPVTIGELADRITAWERGVEIADISPDARKSVYNSLAQTHLPHLDEHGIVTYDRSTGRVELAPNAARLARYVPSAPASDERLSRLVLATAVVAGAVAGANALGAFAPAMAVNALVVGLFLAVSLAYTGGFRR